jgi:antitoxin MazE
MLISIVPIGNSKGIRLPKGVLEECEITDKLELIVEDKEIILKPIKNKVRSGWNEKFMKMAKYKDDTLTIDDRTDLVMTDWEW